MFAMGVFTAFSMTGYGMTKHHLTHRGPGWRCKLVINLSAGMLSTSVVAIFAIPKFTDALRPRAACRRAGRDALCARHGSCRAVAGTLAGVRALHRIAVGRLPGPNLGRAAHDLVLQAKRDHPDATVTVLLPRRTYSALLGRLLHDRTADKIARVVSRIPGASAQIVAYDISSRIAQAEADRAAAVKASDRHLSETEEPELTMPVL
jgi:hypothetical protein